MKSILKKKPRSRVNNIIKPVTDKRQYRGLVLDNELTVLLISDGQCDVSAASLSIQIGQMCDPRNLAGLAHLCEHVITLGSEKYPEENSYQNFLTRNGGKSNAYTYSAMTRFYFEVASEKFEIGLDRFANCFVSPLMSESAIIQEIKVINSEYERNLYDDQWRIRQVNKHMADPNHPYRTFGTGNTMTLETIPKKIQLDVRGEVVNFYKKWYSANLMCLVVIGQESLDKLEDWVVTKFSDIENKNLEDLTFNKQPYLEENYGTKVYITPIKDFRSLILSFTTEDLNIYFRSRPEDYVTHLIEHKGNGSILSELRNREWSNKLFASHMKIPRGFGFLDLTISLTEEGLEHVDEIIQLVFEYLKMIRDKGPKKWIYDEITNINDLDFRFREKESTRAFVMQLVQSLHLYPLDEVITGPILSLEWRPELIRNLMDSLKPSRCRILLIAKKFEPTTYDIEPIYKTKYRRENIPRNLMDLWETCKANWMFYLPEHNPYIPTDFTIFPKESPGFDIPAIIFDSPFLRTWYKQDTEYVKPMTYMHIELTNPIVSYDTVASNLTHMLVIMFLDSFYEVLFYINLSGMEFTMAPTFMGITMILSGYTHKLKLLLETVVNKLFDFKIKYKSFDLFKEERMRYLKNTMTEQPYKHALYCLQLLVSEKCFPNSSYVDVMKVATAKDLERHIKDFLERLNVECFIYGNTDRRQALDISNFIKQKLEKTSSLKAPFLTKQLLPPRDYKLCEGESYMFEFFTKYSKLRCTLLYLQCGKRRDDSVVLIEMLAKVMDQPCRDYLRIKDLLGYVVKCDTWNTRNTIGLYITVQSDKDPAFIEDRIERFLVEMVEVISNMSDDLFERHKNALQLSLNRTAKTSLQTFYKLLEQISNGLYQFHKEETIKSKIKVLTKKDIMDFYLTNIKKESPSRRALFVYIYSPNAKKKESNKEVGTSEAFAELFSYQSLTDQQQTHNKITDVVAFKTSLELYPLTKQYLNVRFKGKQVLFNYN